MARKMNLPVGFAKIDFQRLYLTALSPKGRIRCLAMLHLQKGRPLGETAEIVQQSRQAVHDWLDWLRADGGLERLTGFVRGRGRKKKLGGVSDAQVKQAVLELSSRRQGGRMTAKDAQRLIREKWGVEYVQSSIYAIFRRLNLVWITARSRHPQADPQQQEDFKKTSRKKRGTCCPRR